MGGTARDRGLTLPHNALVGGVHGRPEGAGEVVGELNRVGEGPQYAILGHAVGVTQDGVAVVLRAAV